MDEWMDGWMDGCMHVCMYVYMYTCIRIHMTSISDRFLSPSSTYMLWADRVLAGSGLLRDVFWGFACPIHCGPSGLPWPLSGLFLELLLGIG